MSQGNRKSVTAYLDQEMKAKVEQLGFDCSNIERLTAAPITTIMRLAAFLSEIYEPHFAWPKECVGVFNKESRAYLKK